MTAVNAQEDERPTHASVTAPPAVDVITQELAALSLPDEAWLFNPWEPETKECVICTHGVFTDPTTHSTSMGYFNGMYSMFGGLVQPAKLHDLMARYWNDELRKEYPNVPKLTAEGVKLHYDAHISPGNWISHMK